MELPKNITQIGETNHNCKIYVEDYVISYIKQVNQLALNKEIGVALYGVRKTEGNVMYLFIYGACKLDFLHRETRHLSQAQSQEIEKLRKKYFPNYEFQGYRLLNGEMVEGFHVYEQEICRYIAGYAQFYEKNDSMLAYMLDVRQEEAAPEVVDREKYEMVKRRQEERRTQYGESGFRGTESYEERVQKEREPEAELVYEGTVREAGRSTGDRVDRAGGEKRTVRTGGKSKENATSGGVRGMRLATVAVFAVLCVAGVATLGQGRSLGELQEAAKQAMSSLTEQKLPDAQEANSQNAVTRDTVIQNAQNSTLIAEDKLAEALQAENVATRNSSNGQVAGTTQAAQGTTGETQEGAAQTTSGDQQLGATQAAQEGTAGAQQAGSTQTAQGGTTGAQQSGTTQTAQGITTDQQADTTQTAQVTTAEQQAGTTQAAQGTTGDQQAGTNQTAQGTTADQQIGTTQADTTQTAQGTTNNQSSDAGQQASTQEPVSTANNTTTQEASNTQEADNATEAAAQPTSYIIQEGDTLIGISVRAYGTDTMVTEICSMNQISDPDDIKVGQKILLP